MSLKLDAKKLIASFCERTKYFPTINSFAIIQYEKENQEEWVAFIERSPHTTQ
jgi:hypothetical protein